jgi:hypothetical protein
LVSSRKLGWVGALIAFLASIGWFRQIFPEEHRIAVPDKPLPVAIVSSRRKVAHIAAIPDRFHRARLPLEIYPVSAGIKGGLAGSVAMAAVAMLYGLVSYGSIWYPVNLLGAVLYAETQLSAAQLTVVHFDLLLVATLLHLTFCSGASEHAGSVAVESPVSSRAWQRQPPKSRWRRSQLRHGSGIQSSPRKR